MAGSLEMETDRNVRMKNSHTKGEKVNKQSLVCKNFNLHLSLSRCSPISSRFISSHLNDSRLLLLLLSVPRPCHGRYQALDLTELPGEVVSLLAKEPPVVLAHLRPLHEERLDEEPSGLEEGLRRVHFDGVRNGVTLWCAYAIRQCPNNATPPLVTSRLAQYHLGGVELS